MAVALGSSLASAHDAGSSSNHNVANISVTESVSVKQDWLRVTLSTTVQATKAREVQKRINAAVRKTLALANKVAADGKMEVSSGGMHIYFRSKNGSSKKIFSSDDGDSSTPILWSGSAEVVLQGTHFARILSTADAVQSMTVQSLEFGISPHTRRQAGEKAQQLATEAFVKKAKKVSKAFGFSQYHIREVHVQSSGAGVPTAMNMNMNSYQVDATSSVPAQAGVQQVEAIVSGSIQMQ